MKKIIMLLITGLVLSSCNKLLDKEPLDEITPEVYFADADQLGAYAINYYSFTVLSGYTDVIGEDSGTDIQVSGVDDRWVPGEWVVPESSSNWTFTRIRAFNYFFEQVLPKYEAGEISGSESDIEHYIGEVYFLRAYEYFEKLKEFGDFPIITDVLEDDMELLIAANEREPMNHVARFILSDLDNAIDLMTAASSDGTSRNRLTKNAARLFKSRVALYVGTWLKYFKGTAFVPGGTGWPGEDASYNSGKTLYESGIDSEITFFLTEAMEEAAIVAELQLTENTFDDPTQLQYSPYVRMFADYDLSTYPEIIFWKDYDLSMSISHSVNNVVQWAVSGGGFGFTKGYMESFLMQNGKPIYAEGSGYQGDLNFVDLRADRDDRLQQFIKAPGDVLSEGYLAEYPEILGSSNELSTTGYIVKKFKSNLSNAAQNKEDTGSPIFRAAEAYLNYIEADYELNGSVSAKSETYWGDIRERAGVERDYRITDQYTDMSIEAKNNFAAYSAGQIVDVTLYNIRRERASEFISEGYRYDDIRRWRSIDQLITTPYQVEGMNLWGSDEINSWYTGQLYYTGDNKNMSSPEDSDYLRPFQKSSTSLLYNGMTWTAAHYLSPIDMKQFNITSESLEDGGSIDHSTSPLYQNPGWPTVSSGKPTTVVGF